MSEAMTDIVAELDRWLEAHATGWQKTRPLIQRARDEIVALRKPMISGIACGHCPCCVATKAKEASRRRERRHRAAACCAAAIRNQGDET